jgi:hypothetical protein
VFRRVALEAFPTNDGAVTDPEAMKFEADKVPVEGLTLILEFMHGWMFVPPKVEFENSG